MFYDVAVGANAAYDQIITFAKLMEKNIHVNEPEFKIEYNILFFLVTSLLIIKTLQLLIFLLFIYK